MATSLKLSRDDEGMNVDHRSMIGSLLYQILSRPDITFIVGVCSRYQAKSKESHIAAIK